MYRMLLTTLCCAILVVGINGAWLKRSESINEDAIELTKLGEKIWSLKPAIMERVKPFTACQIMDKCCDDQELQDAISSIDQNLAGTVKYHFEDMIDKCMDLTSSKKKKSECSIFVKSIIPSWIVDRNPDAKKYTKILDKYFDTYGNYFNNITTTCNRKEIIALMCLSNTKLVESCANKTVQQIYDSNNKNYKQTIEFIKQLLIGANQEVTDVLFKNTKNNLTISNI